MYMATFSKYDVLQLLAKKMPFYTATQWLKTPLPSLGGNSPSDLIKEGKVNKVYAALQKEVGEDG